MKLIFFFQNDSPTSNALLTSNFSVHPPFFEDAATSTISLYSCLKSFLLRVCSSTMARIIKPTFVSDTDSDSNAIRGISAAMEGVTIGAIEFFRVPCFDMDR